MKNDFYLRAGGSNHRLSVVGDGLIKNVGCACFDGGFGPSERPEAVYDVAGTSKTNGKVGIPKVHVATTGCVHCQRVVHTRRATHINPNNWCIVEYVFKVFGVLQEDLALSVKRPPTHTFRYQGKYSNWAKV